ncbi:MAG: hypothetical protein EPN34_07310 [Burkholderiaceae bacterium]|nr:MAG: hypothetical protein EPN34_07310 [Burkholderiaceae bacterium]
MRSRWWWGFVGVLSALALAGCAAGPEIVVARARAGAAPPSDATVLQAARYRFVPGPAVAGQPTPAQLEPLAQVALSTVGAVRDDTHPNVSVEVTATVRRGEYDNRNGWGLPPAYWGADHYLGFGEDVGDGWVGNDGHALLGGSDLIPVWDSTVTLTLRDLATGKIVYRTSARHRGTMGASNALLGTLFLAALQGYPNPPHSLRRIVLPLVPQPAPAAAFPLPRRSPLADTAAPVQ